MSDTVAYTLTFTEAVQSVAEGDLQVDGADIDSVVHRQAITQRL